MLGATPPAWSFGCHGRLIAAPWRPTKIAVIPRMISGAFSLADVAPPPREETIARVPIPEGSDDVHGTARACALCARQALIHRFMIEGTGPQELSADHRIYAAGLEALVGGRFAGWGQACMTRSLCR